MIEIFQYPRGPEPLKKSREDIAEAWPMAPDLTKLGNASANAKGEDTQEWSERMLAEARLLGFEAGRQQGIQEGHLAERKAHTAADAAAETRRIEQAAELVEQFAQERNRFMQLAEREVVELSLAIAARILRREAQMDPLLLTGAVRVALGQLSNSTQVRLRVPPDELELWTESIALVPNLSLRPAVVEGEGMRLGDCLIETELGSVDLGIRAQLGEIERGFFDRASRNRAPVTLSGNESQKREPR